MLSTLILYSIASFALSIIPGPNMLVTLNNGLSKNKRIIGMGMLGTNIADLILIIGVALGLGALLNASEALFAMLKWAGVAYLLWLSVQMWLVKPVALDTTAISSTPKAIPAQNTARRAFNRSFWVALFNPKAILFFTAFLPQFISTSMPQAPQYMALGAVTMVIDTIVMLIYAASGMQAAKFLTAVGLKRLNRFCAILMGFLAGGLALYQKTQD